MSDFLQRWVERALGTAHPVRPAPRSTRRGGGEAPLALEIEREVEVPPCEQKEPPNVTLRRALPVRPRADAPLPPAPPRALPVRPRADAPPPATVPPRTTEGPSVPKPPTPLLPPIELRLSPAPPVPVAVDATAPELEAPQPTRVVQAPTVTARRQAPPSPRLERPPERVEMDRAVVPSEAPVIRVSIGRVDVRAATPPAPPAARVPPPDPPSVALSRYLDERERGRR
jgi:hypothetical protein